MSGSQLKGLSCMTGNCHVQFLGEGAVVTPFPYPPKYTIAYGTIPSICQKGIDTQIANSRTAARSAASS